MVTGEQTISHAPSPQKCLPEKAGSIQTPHTALTNGWFSKGANISPVPFDGAVFKGTSDLDISLSADDTRPADFRYTLESADFNDNK